MYSTVRNHDGKRFRGSRRGAAAVEFAITAPIFFLFLLAAFEFGWLNVIRHTADSAAYEAARTAMVPGATAADATAKATGLLNIVGARGAYNQHHAVDDHELDDRGDRGHRHPNGQQRPNRAAVHVEHDVA